ncbi:hypothetical protein GLOIN_2v1554901 [Rhizophagus irregularis DAOM 181602=DAOM 197198]|uniref:Uncharacterized protein n=1 Tax=Rhizophagus irregularis (strain DAOM 181602 / DAOM 197198 / MUCL 43194) TaxID=747089 RepID=A0A2P4QGA5_RHIID|nr:hypothetical protein GLOIN_2v1554901 [Rhizophagus irregularis DAOM 181602=DAOM 197198]POG76672.1 hypothetical protein GLOIN_2v1554901 [Rhizophagus irregularis DAOM 181602=DAOM 197198]|eukprot:XP_025183538.1 hypothetical protein GLOIN_2v1554901 [Rhizophagus irregularis DAOM 181602=DAOM 197198]
MTLQNCPLLLQLFFLLMFQQLLRILFIMEMSLFHIKILFFNPAMQLDMQLNFSMQLMQFKHIIFQLSHPLICLFLCANTDCYEGFKTVYNTEISEKYHPILMAAMENAERAPPAILTNTKVHDIIQCFQCGKF